MLVLDFTLGWGLKLVEYLMVVAQPSDSGALGAAGGGSSRRASVAMSRYQVDFLQANRHQATESLAAELNQYCESKSQVLILVGATADMNLREALYTVLNHPRRPAIACVMASKARRSQDIIQSLPSDKTDSRLLTRIAALQDPSEVWATALQMFDELDSQQTAIVQPAPNATSNRDKAGLKLVHSATSAAITADEPPSPLSINSQKGVSSMSNLNNFLSSMMQIDGAVAVAVVDANSGMLLAKAGGGGVNLELAAAGNTEVVRAKLKTMKSLSLNDTIEDILITLGKQYHIIRLMPGKPGLFLYVVLDKEKSNLAMARYKIMESEKSISL
jgi:predicted regulator of Ras-like GTPase activity (Roadblock/LC7/MglB family)